MRQAVFLLLAIALVAAGCGSSTTTTDPARVQELTSIEPLREAFNDDRGTPRLFLLLSPT